MSYHTMYRFAVHISRHASGPVSCSVILHVAGPIPFVHCTLYIGTTTIRQVHTRKEEHYKLAAAHKDVE